MQPLRIAIAQTAPRPAAFDENLAPHHELIAEARTAGANLVVFPELGLTGYLLQDLAAEVAIRLDDARLAELAAATAGLCAVVSFVEESGRPPPVHRHLRDVPGALQLPGPGPEGDRREPLATAAAADRRPHPGHGPDRSRPAESPDGRCPDQHVRCDRGPDRRPADRGADRRACRLVRWTDRQHRDAVHRRDVRLPRPAVHHPAVGGLPRDADRARDGMACSSYSSRSA
jgi:Carbon-nitrogen hydrolase